MGHFLFSAFQWLRRKLLLFIAIVLVLMAGRWIHGEWTRLQSNVDQLPKLEAAKQTVDHYQTQVERELRQKLARLSSASAQQLDGEIRAIGDEISRLEREKAGMSLLSATSQGTLAEHLRNSAQMAVRIELLRQAGGHLAALRNNALVLADRQLALNMAEQLRQKHEQVYAALRARQTVLARAEAKAGLLGRIPLTPSYREIERLNTELRALYTENSRAFRDHQAHKTRLARWTLPAAPRGFEFNEQPLLAARAELDGRLHQARVAVAKSPFSRAYASALPVLPYAMAVLIGWWLVPAAIRTVFFYGLAPLAARRPAIVMSNVPAVSKSAPAMASAVSLKIALRPGDEMLIRPDYCQSQPAGITLTTQLLFDWRRPLTSMAAQLCMLNRFRSSQDTHIVVSATGDAFDEVAVLEIAAGESLVLQPRALVGMVCKAGQRPRIRSHWRLGTLHAWLTLQLRYLVFEGQATLIIKGCRGVRLEPALQGRMIHQTATIGFSTNASYATVRADPFIAYLRGRQPLFFDSFTGRDAYYLYEEVPRGAGAGTRASNPVEALFDAGLKAFGI